MENPIEMDDLGVFPYFWFNTLIVSSVGGQFVEICVSLGQEAEAPKPEAGSGPNTNWSMEGWLDMKTPRIWMGKQLMVC